MKRKYHKPARWALAVGLPGKAPSPEARRLASAPVRLPIGAWHVSDYASADLTRVDPVITDAVHVLSGATFRLASMPDGPILALEAITVASEKVLSAGSADPTAWANRQRWQVQAAPLNGTGR